MPTVKRTIYYHEITSDPSPHFDTMLEAICRLPEADRVYSHHGQEVLISVEARADHMRGRISLLRDNGLPAIGRRSSAATRDLKLDDDEGLSELSHFIALPDNGMVGFEYNHHGPRVSLLFQAVNSVYQNAIDPRAEPVEWAILQGRDGLERIASSRGIKRLEIGVSRTRLQGRDLSNQSLNQAFNDAARIGESEKIDIVLRSGRSRGSLLMRPIDFLQELLPNKEDELEEYDRFKATIINETGATEVLDLFKNRVNTTAVVETAGRSRAISGTALLDQMEIDTKRIARDND